MQKAILAVVIAASLLSLTIPAHAASSCLNEKTYDQANAAMLTGKHSALAYRDAMRSGGVQRTSQPVTKIMQTCVKPNYQALRNQGDEQPGPGPMITSSVQPSSHTLPSYRNIVVPAAILLALVILLTLWSRRRTNE